MSQTILPAALALAAASFLAGCASDGTGANSAASQRPIGGEPIGAKLSEETEHVVMNVREMNELARQSVELLALFSSNNPKDWERARRDLRIIGKPFVPPDVEALMKFTEGADANKASMARMELGRRAKIARILQKLDSKKYDDWKAARFEIQRMGDDAVPYLVSALILEFRGMKQLRYEWARRELIAIGAPAIPYLEGFLLATPADRSDKKGDSDVILRDQCATTLCQMGDLGRPSIEKAVASDWRWVHVAVAKGIGNAPAPAFAPQLRRILIEDEAWEARAEAALAYGRLKLADGVPVLVQALKDPDSMVRRLACKALGETGSIDAAPALIAVLENEPQSAHSDAALGALIKISGMKYGPDAAPWRNWYQSKKTGR